MTVPMPASQLPWKLSPDGYSILDAQGVEVMDDQSCDPADAAFIIEAVNGYYVAQINQRTVNGDG